MYAVIFNGNACELSINALDPYPFLLLAPRLVVESQRQSQQQSPTLSLLLCIGDVLMICDFPNTTNKTQTITKQVVSYKKASDRLMIGFWTFFSIYMLLLTSWISI
jgi:uncharacterized membrane protein